MKLTAWIGAALTVTALLLSGCDKVTGGGSSLAVLDLAAVARATGQDETIRKQAETARADLTTQLQQLATNLEQQLAAERTKIGKSPSDADAQRLQDMTAQARQQINNAQLQAQNQASLIETDLVNAFRDQVMPLAEEIAQSKGASVVLAVDSYLFWFDPTIDITDEVIAAWRASAEPAEEVEEVVEPEPERAALENAPVAAEPVAPAEAPNNSAAAE